MSDNGFTVSLDKIEPISIKGTELSGDVLQGKPIYRKGSTGLADALDAVTAYGLITVPPYRLISGRAFAGKDEQAWTDYHDTKAERIIALDKKGIMGGAKGDVYVLDIQNGGLFVSNPQRIRDAIKSNKLFNYALKLRQGEVNDVLDAIANKDTDALKDLIHGGNVAFAGDYNGFLEASASPDFIQEDTTYTVIRPIREAIVYSGEKDIGEQRENPDLVIVSGGKAALGKMLDQAKEFGWRRFATWNDDYNNINTGRVVCLGRNNVGIIGGRHMNSSGRPVGVDPDTLNAFYKLKHAHARSLTDIVDQDI